MNKLMLTVIAALFSTLAFAADQKKWDKPPEMKIDVKKGEQIKFVLRNNGELEHEFVLATTAENLKHAEAMKKNPEGPTKDLEPFLDVMEHSAEHYGLLVAYYRANDMVPPASRPKKK